jgi:hypothetical protein
MRTSTLLLACPIALLVACTLKVNDPNDDGGATDGSVTDTDGHSSDTDAHATDPDPSNGDPSDPAPIDDPANDGCVPQESAVEALHEPSLREPTTEEPEPGSTAGDEAGSTAGDDDGTAGDTEGDTGSATDGDDDGGTWDDTGEQECEPLPVEKPSPEDNNCECDVQGEHRDCKDGTGVPGTRFCDGGKWGPCVAEPECLPGTYSVCFNCDPEWGTWVSWCNLYEGTPSSNEDDCSTPLVLSFDGRAVEYTSVHAEFAMSERDRCGARDWPTAATPWLAIDLDRNGNIDGGHELFGSGSRLAGRVDNGFAALAALDSDADGQISAADESFAELVVWSDDDADRRSTLWELQPLASHGVVAIDLHYTFDASRCTDRGNCEGERATFVFESADGARSSGEIVDIRLSCQ